MTAAIKGILFVPFARDATPQSWITARFSFFRIKVVRTLNSIHKTIYLSRDKVEGFQGILKGFAKLRSL